MTLIELLKIINVIKSYECESAELKRLLKLAIEDLNKYEDYADIGLVSRACLCKSCKTRDITNRICQECKFKWNHSDEAMKLI